MWVNIENIENISDKDVIKRLTYIKHDFQIGEMTAKGHYAGKSILIDCDDIRYIKENRVGYIWILPKSRFLDTDVRAVKFKANEVGHIYLNEFRLK